MESRQGGGKRMIGKFQRRFALSEKGAWDTVKGSIACALQNVSFMFPVGLLYLLVGDLLNGNAGEHILIYVSGCILCAALILITTWFQYNGTFLATYRETGTRRIALAERLRKIPLSFFGKKDLADLTSAIMNDCKVLEESQSHFVAPLIGSVISTVLIAVSLLFFNWKMALAALWVLPVSFAIIAFSSKIQRSFSKKSTQAKLVCEDGIQECLESINDLRSNNAEERYVAGLEKKIRAVEKRAIIAEFGTAAFVVTADLVLRLGIATTALVGAAMLVSGETDILMFFMFMLAAAKWLDCLLPEEKRILNWKSYWKSSVRLFSAPLFIWTSRLVM